MAYVYKYVDSPLGKLKVILNDERLAAILWETERPDRVRLGEMVEVESTPMLEEVERQLQEYFAGRRSHFDVPLDFKGTDFQKKVWHALLTIPYGETRSYLQIAVQVGNPKAVRAVGAANGKNPISIVAPCHRVIGSGGQLTGFAGGLQAKNYLLALETRDLARLESARHEDVTANGKVLPASRSNAQATLFCTDDAYIDA
jgi:methylated-DNA-[protein]-cysteine S-methyltransferase